MTLPDVKVGFDASLSGNALLDVDGAASKPYVSEPILLNDEPWELPELWVGPVLLTPSLDFTARLEATPRRTSTRARSTASTSVAVSVGTKSGVSAPAPKLTQEVLDAHRRGVEHWSLQGEPARGSLLAYDTFGFSTELHAFRRGSRRTKASRPAGTTDSGSSLTPAIRLTIPGRSSGLRSWQNTWAGTRTTPTAPWAA
ncbi:MAG: hypothetical protein IPM35_41620 [Myxococcales bacterium]|nr:hypothetical protein [Myxococcales bacterium]